MEIELELPGLTEHAEYCGEGSYYDGENLELEHMNASKRRCLATMIRWEVSPTMVVDRSGLLKGD